MRLRSQDFAGSWSLERQIDDRHSGHEGRFEGRAVLTPDGDGLIYDEAGTLRLGSGPSMTAERRYLWRFGVGGVEVRFADGAAFHRFVPMGAGAGTDHPCGADYYRVRYDFNRWPDWEAVWTVSGPRKDYTSYSRYARA